MYTLGILHCKMHSACYMLSCASCILYCIVHACVYVCIPLESATLSTLPRCCCSCCCCLSQLLWQRLYCYQLGCTKLYFLQYFEVLVFIIRMSKFRRVKASPNPKHTFGLRTNSKLLNSGDISIAGFKFRLYVTPSRNFITVKAHMLYL